MQTHTYIRYFLTALVCVCSLSFLWGQQEEKQPIKKIKKFEPNNAVLIVPYYTAQFPFGKVADRFGFNSLFGAHLSYKTKTNWLVGAEGAFLYGTKVKEGYVLNNISTSAGLFVTQYNDLTSVKLEEHGGVAKFTFGKIVPFVSKYPDAGFLWMMGIGFLQHKIAINVKAKELPQLASDYKKGYDRLSNGPVISEFVGATFMARRKYLSAYLGLQFDLALTQNRRPFDFYEMKKLTGNNVDMFLGIKVGYIIPVFLQTSEKEYFYY